MNLIEIFNKIRDIQFRIPTSTDDPSMDCDEKHKRLFNLLTKTGYKVRYRVCSFSWSSLNIPKKILNIQHKDECEHLFLEIFLNNKWVILDASWDIGLKNIFTVNEWNGKTNTEIAVKPTEIFPPQKKHELSHTMNKDAILEDMKESGKFYEALNGWLEENRL